MFNLLQFPSKMLLVIHVSRERQNFGANIKIVVVSRKLLSSLRVTTAKITNGHVSLLTQTVEATPASEHSE